MFENEIEFLKNEIDKMLEENKGIANLLIENTKDKGKVDDLVQTRNDMIYYKEMSIILSIVAGFGVIASLGLTLLLSPLSFLSNLAIVLIFGGSPALIVPLYSLASFIHYKSKYKKLATNENLELEKNIEEILSNIMSLEEKINIVKENKDKYENLIAYFEEYNNKVSLLESVVKDEKDDLEDLFNEYLEERVDYSKVHLIECVLPEKVKIKDLANRIK